MFVNEIRAAITAAGATPVSYVPVDALRELVTAYGGTPTQFSYVGLLQEAVTAKGGTPTQFSISGLVRELLTAGGVTPGGFGEQGLWAQLASIVPAPTGPVLGPELNPDPGFDSPSSWAKNNLDSGGSTGITVSGGKGRFASPGDDCRLAINVGTQPAGTYQIQIDADSNPEIGGTGGFIVGAGTSATSFRAEVDSRAGITFGITGPQTLTISPTGSFTWLIINAVNGTGIIDNFSLKSST